MCLECALVRLYGELYIYFDINTAGIFFFKDKTLLLAEDAHPTQINQEGK